MNYQELLYTITEIIENPKINKSGLSLTYTLPEAEHRALNEELCYNSNPTNPIVNFTDIFEIEIEGLLIKIVKLNEKA